MGMGATTDSRTSSCCALTAIRRPRPTAGGTGIVAGRRKQTPRLPQSLQALTPPQENRATLNDFLAAVKNEVDALGRANTAVQSGADTSSADTELASAKQNAESAATQYGMKDCGNAKSRHTQAGGAT